MQVLLAYFLLLRQLVYWLMLKINLISIATNF